ncbi:elongation of very long chain fatty acids protein AAEL008004-like [Argiope bruennichi]|uniref:elongation of very long chain fatty acids protein AAEL008004-like n=1 Tax=Argiope bruennichi TaxID=94029 RepID=UPI002494D503|nr:elongation of very long chain fatty acids protein AAEL008004-like [Argiope bruennichi]XP_055924363.1 elongation of very long chain fatty acids protein AAEL008004-like [Argiope bruennichi]XP_055924364.1 elongation of very long chain fatty acids protein AAEL008004-like [Argiope bruennichi]XP_055924365.1 elongation of very long chain fatty acids protein AAEL008004-like [Argiope bruennichi]
MMKKHNDKYYARYGDPRTANWLLMDNQMYPFLIAALYLVTTKLIVPMVMRKRNPIELRWLSVAYNIGMCLLNAWVLYELGNLTVLNPKFDWFCQPIDWSNSPEAMRVAEVGWIFLLTTILECITTILIILRKKESYSSAVHTFVRTQALIVAWYGLKFAPGGYNSLYCLLNVLIYAVLHFHHAAVISMPFFKHWHWETVTLALIYVLQFSIYFVYYSQLYFFPPRNCKPSFFVLRLNMGIALLFFVFGKDFFVSVFNFISGKKKSTEKQKK